MPYVPDTQQGLYKFRLIPVRAGPDMTMVEPSDEQASRRGIAVIGRDLNTMPLKTSNHREPRHLSRKPNESGRLTAAAKTLGRIAQ
jgi:hypothetical protein